MELAISTVIPTYNRAHFLARSINSVLVQLSGSDEVIVIDDGSTDDTEGVVASFGDRVRYLKTRNRGAGAARNLGIREARNPLIAFLDSDDEWFQGKIQIQRAFMQARTEVLFCFTNFSSLASDGARVAEKHFKIDNWTGANLRWIKSIGPGNPISSCISLPDGFDDFSYHVGSLYLLQFITNYISVITLMVRREDAGEALHFAEDTKTFEDWEAFGRLARAGHGAYLDIETACEHVHKGPRITNTHPTEYAHARVVVLERVWGNDKEFQEEYGAIYQRILDQHRLTYAEGLIVRGETKKARQELKKLTSAPWTCKVLAAFPGPLTEGLVKLRRKLKSIYKHGAI